MPDEETKATPSQPEASAPPDAPPKPDILGQVEYAYSSIAQIAVGASDVRIAFGDHIPPDGKIRPLFGVTLLPDHALRLAMALLTQIHSSPHAKRLTGNIPVIPADLAQLIHVAGLKNWKILRSPEGHITGLYLLMKDGTEKTVGESELSPEAKTFLGQMVNVENLAKEQVKQKP
jgi:hypothetical protein